MSLSHFPSMGLREDSYYSLLLLISQEKGGGTRALASLWIGNTGLLCTFSANRNAEFCRRI